MKKKPSKEEMKIKKETVIILKVVAKGSEFKMS